MDYREFRQRVAECPVATERRCAFGDERIDTALRVAEKAIDHSSEQGFDALDPKDLGDQVDRLNIRTCLESAGIPVPVGHDQAPEDGATIIEFTRRN